MVLHGFIIKLYKVNLTVESVDGIDPNTCYSSQVQVISKSLS